MIRFATVLSCALAAMKLFGIITLSWLGVTLPIIIAFGVSFAMLVIGFAFLIVVAVLAAILS